VARLYREARFGVIIAGMVLRDTRHLVIFAPASEEVARRERENAGADGKGRSFDARHRVLHALARRPDPRPGIDRFSPKESADAVVGDHGGGRPRLRGVAA
jgi:hypothetical protein